MKGRWFANDDIPVNILSRLSAKALHRLKYVSKDWYNLISSRSFIRFQLKKSEPVVGFFFQDLYQGTNDDAMNINYIPLETETIKIRHTVLNFLPENVVILSSINGLLCCRSCFPTKTPRMYICNPLNKQWISLKWHNLSRRTITTLAFDASQNPIDASTHFKLVAVTNIEVEDHNWFFFEIYSSKTDSWTTSEESIPCNHNLAGNKGVFVDGNLYWLTDGYQILMFDPENDLPWLIDAPLPSTEFNCIPEMCMGESNNKLNYVIISEYGLQLWVLEDHFSSQWGLKFSLSLEKLEEENSVILYRIREKMESRTRKDDVLWMDPLAFEDGVLLLRVSTKLYSYKFETREMKELCDISPLGRNSMFGPIVVPYTMSLVPLDQA